MTIKLYAREGRVVQILSEQQINIEQLSLQCDGAVARNQQLQKMVEEACHRVTELEIVTDLPVGMWIHKLSSDSTR